MQDRQQIQKEIDAVRLQISIVDTAATTAPDDEKERWKQKRVTLQARLEALQRDLAACKGMEEDNAVPVFDDAEADAMFNQILLADDSPVVADAPAEPEKDISDKDADEMLGSILAADEGEANSVPADEPIIMAPPPSEPADYPDTNAMFDSIFSAADNEHEPESVQPQTNDYPSTADMLADILGAEEPKEEKGEYNLYDYFTPREEHTEETPVAPEPVREEPQPEPIEQPAAERPTGSERLYGDGRVAQQLFVTPDEDVREEQPIATKPPVQPVRASGISADAMTEIERLRAEAEEANRKAQAALSEAEKLREEAERTKLAAETERAMYAAEMELQRGLRSREEAMREEESRAEKERISEKIARRKAEITEIRNGLQEVKDSESAFALREKLFSVQLVLDDDERNSPEISYLLTKSLDDLSHLVEVAELRRRIAALVEAKKEAAKKQAAKKKKPAKKAAPKKKKVAAASRRRPPVRAGGRRRAPSRYAPRPRR